MQVRSLTLGIPTSVPLKGSLEDLLSILGSLRDNLIAANIPVATIRASFEPILGGSSKQVDEWKTRVGTLATEIAAMDVNYFSAPFWVEEVPLIPAISKVMEEYSQLFVNLDVVNQDGSISGKRIQAAAALMKDLAKGDPFNNLRFCASARAIPNTPFFPAAYHDPKRPRPTLSIALETADEVVKASKEFAKETNTGHNFAEIVRKHIQNTVNGVIEGIGTRKIPSQVDFLGIDLSPAPFPETSRSIGHALELASGLEFGEPAILGTIAQIVEGIRQVDCPRWGFNGVMLPVLEDATIAQRTKEDKVTLESLLLYSTVCGTGLDTVPIPGDTSDADLQQLIYSIAVLATQLRKPLTARLMPIPGKTSGELTTFSFEYFANAAVMKVPRKNFMRLPEC